MDSPVKPGDDRQFDIFVIPENPESLSEIQKPDLIRLQWSTLDDHL